MTTASEVESVPLVGKVLRLAALLIAYLIQIRLVSLVRFYNMKKVKTDVFLIFALCETGNNTISSNRLMNFMRHNTIHVVQTVK